MLLIVQPDWTGHNNTTHPMLWVSVCPNNTRQWGCFKSHAVSGHTSPLKCMWHKYADSSACFVSIIEQLAEFKEFCTLFPYDAWLQSLLIVKLKQQVFIACRFQCTHAVFIQSKPFHDHFHMNCENRTSRNDKDQWSGIIWDFILVIKVLYLY